ncbi:MAG TPA: phenylalanine--tRNA ligase subunit alpha [Bacilli bacterium]|nr:phenylalanine--tRNA ligase subunit alpha [Bacilli bacterium]
MKKEEILKLKESILKDFKDIKDSKKLEELRLKYNGKKGLMIELSKNMGSLSNEAKKEFGALLNEVKNLFNAKFNEISEDLKQKEINKKLANETIDITLPGTRVKTGSKHILSQISEELENLFVSMGYDVVEGPEVESDYLCFEVLNVPKGHPARDMQDTFYITDEMLLRTQTSSVQARTMMANIEKSPIRMVCLGKTYRKDEDASHSHQFMQIEGLVIDKGISLANLKGTLEVMMKKLLGDDVSVRFRPSYFPFTEPSYEVDVSCFKCGGKGCPLCKQTGWIEVLGSGMVHPNVLRNCGYDPEIYSGFAFGAGIERLAMFKYGVPDIRTFYANDLRFLDNFSGKEVE